VTRAARGASLALALGACGIPCAGAASAARPNVLLVTVDTLRPDALGWIGGTNETPALDALAREGLRFRAAVSEVPLTLPSHTSIMSALLPRHHGVRDNGQVVARGLPLLAERMKAAGYETGAFVSGYPLRKVFALDRGFDRYEDTLPVGNEGWTERPAPATTAAALEWVRQRKAPWFLWVHYYDAHDPYTPPRAFFRPGPRGAYDGEVAFVDASIAKLRAGLPGPPEQVLTVATADHGESLGEHGEAAHGFFVYDATILVPLVLHWPGRIASREGGEHPRLIDLAPTILDLLGLPPLPSVDGVSLRPLTEGRAQEIPPAYVETMQPWISYGWSPLKALRTSALKLVEAPRAELFDLAADPRETRNVLAGRAEAAFSLRRGIAKVEARPEAGSQAADDPEVMERLRSLGYVGGGALPGPPTGALADPKDRLKEKELCSQGEALLRASRFDEALVRFESALALDPRNRYATLRSGMAYLKKNDVARAVPRLEAAVRADPQQAEARYALADALTRADRNEEAVQQWLETTRLQPRRAAAWSNLGTVLSRVGRKKEAIAAFAEAVRQEPDNAQLLANLGLAQHWAGDEPAAAAAFVELARVHVRAGRRDEARAALERARAADPRALERIHADPELRPLLQPASN
jgi:arylsulfatase A-like enzyme/Tfp pilus assembly protein PilF